ncbi:MAG: LysM peptidoglycan-binding domain-containing protein [Chloroflexi bacterium]|nr:MAG: LysM peptidoglycan-binding domain-containing protein [Chloroflexota bacterium]
MTRQQAIFLVAVNALLSAVISLLVVFAVYSLFPPSPAVIPVALAGTPLPPTATIRRQPIYYIVKPGDTLSTIAAQFNISTIALMQANGITNPNVLAVGQQLIIPPPDLTAVAPLSTTSSTSVATPVPILRITAIIRATSPQSPVGEMVIVQNIGVRVNVKGWTLADLHGNIYVFPDFVLETNAGVRVHSEAGLDTATDLYWGRTAPVWDANDTATLKDRNAAVIDSYTIRK